MSCGEAETGNALKHVTGPERIALLDLLSGVERAGADPLPIVES
jgi:hypothetical protein